MIFDGGGMRHRFWLRHRDAFSAPVILLPLTTNETALAATEAARRWLVGAPIGAARAILIPSDFQRHRLEIMLRALDASRAGASLRTIGTSLLYPRLADIGAVAWKASSERRRTQRLLAEANAMMGHGYRMLLGGSPRHDGRGDNSDERF
ncbi:MAG: hypothetical protein JWR80_2912 [Bradyrhizobium sp.]|nr:hypothetical protein [Bradyrhizobium sp.]